MVEYKRERDKWIMKPITRDLCQKSWEYSEEKPFLIVINKIDIRKKSTNELIEMYQIERLFNKKGKFGIVDCSSITNEGVEKIKMWLDYASKEIIK